MCPQILEHFSGAWGAGSFTYHTDGDRWKKVLGEPITYGYDWNRMSSANNTTYGYNSDGDMVSAGGLFFDYTDFHRMWRVRNTDGILATIGYDANGKRVYKIAGSETEIFLRGPGGNILADLDGSGNSKMEYIYLNSNLVAQVGHPEQIGTAAMPWLLLLLNSDSAEPGE